MNAYILLLYCINFYSNKVFDFTYSLYKPPITLVTFYPKYTRDANLWTTDKLLITNQSIKPSKK